VRAKKKSQLAAEAAAGGATAPAAASAQAETAVAAAPAGTPAAPAVDAPKVYTGPVRARKKSELAAESARDASPPRAEGGDG
jgi:hypothetical protein